MKASLGLTVDVDILEGFNCSKSTMEASTQLMFAKPGFISTITPVEQLLKLDNVLDAGYNYKLGEEIKAIENATARFGHCVMVSNFGSIEPSIETFKEYFQILDKKGNNLFKVIL